MEGVPNVLSQTSVSQPAATSLNYKLLEFSVMPRTCLETSSLRPVSAVVFLVFVFVFLNKVIYVWGGGREPCIPKFDTGLMAPLSGCLV